MAKISPRILTEAQEAALRKKLFSDIERLQRDGDLVTTLQYILTDSEVIMTARRMEIAKMLVQGFSYPRIQAKLNVGVHTIAAVDRRLSSFRDYRIAIPQMLEAFRKKQPPPAPHSFRWVRKKYPLHFLLFNLLLGDPFK